MHSSINRVMRMKKQQVNIYRPSALMLGLMLGLATPVLEANPSGAVVINGNVSFSQPDTNTLHITNSNGSVINWQEFSINANETTHFQQSGADSAVLNQIVGSNGSEIMGNLSSNGQVFLINQNGIIFGENAVINTAGFVASTLNLSDQDFLEGRLNFEGVNAGDILNQGFITAGADGDIALIAPNIINQGVITVEQGDVILAAGEKLTLTSLKASDVSFEIQSADHTVVNLGSVTTDGGAIGMFAGSLTHSGVIAANALTLDADGNVMLVAKNDLTITENAVVSADGENGGRVLIQSETGTTLVSGSVSASGTNGAGGVVDVLGYQVGIIDNAVLDASGTQAGGQVHVGGNYQGIGELQNATATYVGLNTVIQADAIDAGDGGEIIVWADETTRVHGTISATGGQQSGNGGFVETSGKIFLDVTDINLDLTAANGQAGNWLLDPLDLTISIAADAGVTSTPPGINYIFTASTTGSNLNVDTLLAQLNSGVSVEIDTGGVGAEAGDLTVNAAIAVVGTTPVSLRLDAANDIIINAAITSDVALDLILNADSIRNDVSDSLGQIVINNSISTFGGSVTLTSAEGVVFNGVGSIDSAGGTISVSTTLDTGVISFAQDPAQVFAINAGLGDVVLNVGSVTDSSSAQDIIANSLSFNTVNGFGTALDPIQTSINTLTSGSNSGTGGIYVDNVKAMTVASIDLLNAGDLNLFNGGDLTIGTINAVGGNVLLDTSVASNGSGGAILSNGLVAINIDSASNIDLVSETGIGSSTSHFGVAGTQSLLNASVAGAGNIYLDNLDVTAGQFVLGSFSINSGDVFVANLNANQATVIAGGWSSNTGNISIESNSIININAGITADVLTQTGSINISALNGDIIFGSTGSVTASAVSLNATGAISDDGTGIGASIGNGTLPVNQFAAVAGNGISLTASGNDADNLSLVSTTGNINYSDVDGFALLAAFATDDGTANGLATGNVTLTAGDAILKANGSVTNIAGLNATITAVNGIGGGASGAIETSLTNSLSFSNTLEGSVDIINQSANDLQVQGVNSTANTSGNDVTQITSPNGSISIAAVQQVSSANADILLDASTINVNGEVSTVNGSIMLKAGNINLAGLVSATGVADVYAIGLITDELDLTGSLNGGAGDVSIKTLTAGTDIYLASSIDNVGLDISQAEIDNITAGRLIIGSQGATVGSGSNLIVFDGAINTGAMATRFISEGNIVFNQGAVTALTNTSVTGVELNTQAEIVDQSSGTDIQAGQLQMTAVNGVGSADAIDTQVASLSVVNQTANDVNIINSGDLSVSASANYGGNLNISSDASLSVSSAVGATGIAGVSASGELALEAATNLLIGGELTATAIRLLAAEAVNINNNMVASGDLSIQADTNNDGVGDVVFENLNGAALGVSVANLDISGAGVTLQASNGGVHVESTGLLNVTAANDLSISGGSIADADAYLSAQGDINLNVAGNLSLTGGTAINTAASIFDMSAVNSNLLTAQVAGAVILNAGTGDDSGAYITAGDIHLTVQGNVDLTGSAAANGAALINATTGSMLVELPSGGLVNKTAGTGVGSVADLIANLGVTILDGAIDNLSSNEVISAPLESVVISANESLVELLNEELADDENSEDTSATEGKVLACR